MYAYANGNAQRLLVWVITQVRAWVWMSLASVPRLGVQKMTRSTHPADDGRLPVFPLRVHRIEPGTRVIVRMLSTRYYGLFTHWDRRRSVYCPGEGCQSALHRGPRYWKGYAAAEVWQQESVLWTPVCLEISEHLELDFRDIYERGQVWELWRMPQTGRHRTPVQGAFLEERPPDSFPAAHDLVPCLKHLYHVERIDLDQKNPLPQRTMVRPSQGQAPSVPIRGKEEPSEITAEERQRVRDMLRGRRGKGAELADTNGNNAEKGGQP